MLVTSCPICYHSFKNEYSLDIPVMHHSEYIEMLMNENKLNLVHSDLKMVYHDPCELGRNSGMYDPPRHVLKKIGTLKPVELDKEKSLCCGGSLSNMAIDYDIQLKIRNNALEVLMASLPEVLVTACPLCKKTFGQNVKTKVMDIAEIVAANIKISKN